MESKSGNNNFENCNHRTIDEQERHFTVLLNDQRELEDQLEEFRKSCDDYDKNNQKRSKRRYYNLALMAKVVTNTTDKELKRLLKNGTRTFLIDMVANKPTEVEIMVGRLRQAVMDQQLEEPNIKLLVGLALQITGNCCRIGRIRNNGSILLNRGNTLTLTTNVAYKYCGFKEIVYAINLIYYLDNLNLTDQVQIGSEILGRVVKKLQNCVTILIEAAGVLNSFDQIQLPHQCYFLPIQTLPDMFEMDLAMARKVQADFIVMPHIRCLTFLKVLRCNLQNMDYTLKLIGTIDLEYVSEKMLDIMAIIKQLDFLWLPNLFNLMPIMHSFIKQDVIPLAKCLKKPLIGTVPLEDCNEFRNFENHELLKQTDCIFIKKSRWCNKYPLIVKKLLPLKDFRMAAKENTMALNDKLSSYESVVNFIIRTISSIECQAIFLYSKCKTAATALSRIEIYCPVFVLIPLSDINVEEEKEIKCHLQLAKNLNLRRNLKVILYEKDVNECGYKPIDFGLEYARRCGDIDMGDFIITIEVAKENGDERLLQGVGEDVIIMRAFYVPPLKVGEEFKC